VAAGGLGAAGCGAVASEAVGAGDAGETAGAAGVFARFPALRAGSLATTACVRPTGRSDGVELEDGSEPGVELRTICTGDGAGAGASFR
jgi:hypothetical protein